MSTEQPSSTQQPAPQADLTRQAQSKQWREIGIASVAAAAHQASEKHAAEAKAANGANRVVTLRDIDYFAA
ncbi:hypothetical protein V5F53_01365 [Xanthobacter sp. V4C-4]|uniref:hypothetical protein n=1 Tax=Xanthobacter cornucopiae TaxID=3119924 RepID=UPI00372CC3E0